MAHHAPTRRSLDAEETAMLDNIMDEYRSARERARRSIVTAQTAYQVAVSAAADQRDDRILGIVDAATAKGYGTQARIAERLGMNPANLSTRIRKARNRATRATNDGSAIPQPEG